MHVTPFFLELPVCRFRRQRLPSLGISSTDRRGGARHATCILKGYSAKKGKRDHRDEEMARSLQISAATIRAHLLKRYRKSGFERQARFARFACLLSSLDGKGPRRGSATGHP